MKKQYRIKKTTEIDAIFKTKNRVQSKYFNIFYQPTNQTFRFAISIGKKYGKHHLEGKLIEGRKSVEGTLAMFVVSFLSVLVVMLANGNIAWYASLPIAVLTAAVCAVVELYTRNGMDTLTCPFAAAAVILPLVHLWGT